MPVPHYPTQQIKETDDGHVAENLFILHKCMLGHLAIDDFIFQQWKTANGKDRILTGRMTVNAGSL